MNNNKSYVIALALILALIKLSNGVPISFNDKLCVDYSNNPADWLTPYSGDYTYNGIINGKPSYSLTKCRYDGNCRNGKTLSIGTDNKWYFNGQPQDGTIRDPMCESSKSDTPSNCNPWWGGGQPTITECGISRTVDNGVSQEETNKQQACKNAANAPKRTSLTQQDKDELLRQFNVQRQRYNQATWKWSNTLEAVAQATSDMCTPGHPLSGDKMVNICKEYEPNNPNCWASGYQGTSGPLDAVNSFLYDGYTNGECVVHGIVSNGIVWSFMQDDHREPMTGEARQKSGHTFISVGCAYNYCNGKGNMACNYM